MRAIETAWSPCRWPGLVAWVGIACLLSGPHALAQGGRQEQAVASSGPGHPQHARPARSGVDDRVRSLAEVLDLDDRQQSEVRRLLLDQREQVTRVWNDHTLPAVLRVQATQVIGDRTADQIRSLLTEAQRRNYLLPRQRDSSATTARVEADTWINKVTQVTPR